MSANQSADAVHLVCGHCDCVVRVPHDGAALRRSGAPAQASGSLCEGEFGRGADDAGRFGIRGIPTLIAFKHGREIRRQVGGMDLDGLLQWADGLG